MAYLLKTMDRQGLLKGDLNHVQRLGLSWLMNRDIDDQIALERMRTENMALASNPATSGEFLKALFEEEVEVFEETDEWQQPQNVEDIEAFLAQAFSGGP